MDKNHTNVEKRVYPSKETCEDLEGECIMLWDNEGFCREFKVNLEGRNCLWLKCSECLPYVPLPRDEGIYSQSTNIRSIKCPVRPCTIGYKLNKRL